MNIVAANAAHHPGYRPVMQGRPSLPVDDMAPQGATTMRALGFNVLLCFLFMIFSRVFDMFLTGLHIPGLAQRLMIFVILITGSFIRVFQNKIGHYLLLLTAWMVLSVPFSVWRGGALGTLTSQWWPSMVVFVAVGGLITDYKQYRQSVTVMAISIFVLSIFCMHYGTMETGRLFMANRSRFSNPNDMAQAMLIGIPFWVALSRKTSSPLGKVACGCVLLFMAYIVSKTGSRGAMISFGILYLVMLYHASAVGKARLLLIASLFVCSAIAFLPSVLKDRYKTLFSEDRTIVTMDAGEQGVLNSAVTSAESREHLIRQSLIITARHPIFGVGAGQFAVAENQLSMSQGKKKGSWLGTHNSFTQIASEVGLPGIFCFLSIFFLCLKYTNSIYKVTKDHPQLSEISAQAEALFLSLVCLAITDMFIHAAYTMLLPVMAGLTVALVNTTRPLLAEAQRRKAAAPATAFAAVRPVYPVGRRLPVSTG